MKENYNKNLVSHTDSHLSDVLKTNKSMTENSLRMRVLAYLAQVKASLLTETIYEINNEKQIIEKNAKTLQDKNLLLKKQAKIIKEQNKKLKKQIELEKQLNQKKEELWLEQSKMASMGSMIGNIAHQWRQPLSVISTLASSIELKSEFGMLDKEETKNISLRIVDQTKYLSKTIDTFRDFLKEDKELKEVVLQDRIKKALAIVDTALSNHHIELISNLDDSNPIKINLILGELAQVIINIVNNAKDALVENKIENPWLRVNLTQKDEIAIITIEDNAGGVPKDILPKIFDPYFTTKEHSKGTGLGLHMGQKIVQDSLKGKIYATNTKDGAIFTLELPLDSR
jgi:C4-dicarboxylate-specific signal transduction histidine kinase